MPITNDAEHSLIKILIIDSQQIAFLGITQLLSSDKQFIACYTARNGDEALQAANKLKPSLIILEPDLEDEDGIALIKPLLKASNARIIIYTGSKNRRISARALAAGAHSIVKKIEPGEALLNALEKTFGESWINPSLIPRIFSQTSPENTAVELSPEQNKLKTLTFKEEKVTRAIQLHSKKTLKQTAAILHISEHTLRNHLASIYHKLEVRNRLELYIFCGKYQTTTDPTDHPRRRSTDI
jgi:DNA-binding NarL/FixJ family response regulator